MKSLIPIRFLPWVYGAIHGLVDFVSALIMYQAMKTAQMKPEQIFTLVLTYDLLAFGAQVFIGLLTDFIKTPKPVLVAGLLALAVAVFVANIAALPAALLAGMGNALFHVGGGAMALRINPGKAVWPGVFVAPGAIGLAYGIRLGKAGIYPGMLLLMALVAALFLAITVTTPDMRYSDSKPTPKVNLGWLIVILLLLTVFVRSIGGMVGGGYCAKTPYTALAIAYAAFLGKGVGGWIADRFGWLKSSLVILLISAPMIAYGYGSLVVVITGMFLFQMTMPVTLTAIAQVMPKKPATAFGLTCLALIGGALPSFYQWIRPWQSHHLVFVLILFSALTTGIALALLQQPSPKTELLQ